jgi:phage tail-like protein
MPPFTVNAQRQDPYKNFKFRVKWEGRYVAGVSSVGGLRRTTEVVRHREGGDESTSHKSPGRTDYAEVTLRRGKTHDLEFERWANKVWSYTNAQAQVPDQEVSLADFRKDITLEIFNEAGQKVLAYLIYRAWPSEYQITDLDANANAVLFEQLTLQHEGFDRDLAVPEPVEPSFIDPP